VCIKKWFNKLNKRKIMKLEIDGDIKLVIDGVDYVAPEAPVTPAEDVIAPAVDTSTPEAPVADATPADVETPAEEAKEEVDEFPVEGAQIHNV
jgi:hypothetical protein